MQPDNAQDKHEEYHPNRGLVAERCYKRARNTTLFFLDLKPAYSLILICLPLKHL